VTVDDAVQAAERDLPLKDVLRQDFPRVAPDTPLADLIPIAAQTRFPIAVVEGDRLLGIIVRVTVLSSLMRKPASNLAQGASSAAATRSNDAHGGPACPGA